jgi:hypothetical protein
MLGKNAAKGVSSQPRELMSGIFSARRMRGYLGEEASRYRTTSGAVRWSIDAGKGLLMLLDAMRQLGAQGEHITLDVLAEGPLKQ